MSFSPSEHSYGGWLEDKYNEAKSYAAGLVSSAEDTALAPVRAAQSAASNAASTAAATLSAAQKTAADVRASAEAARDAAASTASAVPWLVGGAVLLGGAYLLSKGQKRKANPMDGHTAARWLLLGGTVSGAAGAALTTAGVGTLQPEVLALSAPLMVAGAAMIGAAGAAENFHKSARE
jgi:hypothetical protein